LLEEDGILESTESFRMLIEIWLRVGKGISGLFSEQRDLRGCAGLLMMQVAFCKPAA
jgi:hypothetical protein